MVEATFAIEAVIRGYHVYQATWTAAEGEQLVCKRELGNSSDSFAVSVTKASTIVGHVPKKMSAICSLFLHRGGIILCRVTGTRQYSADLPQGGMEVPCILTFRGVSRDIMKAKKILEQTLGTDIGVLTFGGLGSESKAEQNNKRSGDEEGLGNDKKKEEAEPAASGGRTLVNYHINEAELIKMTKDILQGEKLSDREIDFAQHLLKCQFPQLKGLQSTLLQLKKPKPSSIGTDQLQILHSRGDHWIVASNVAAEKNVVNIYDSLFPKLDEETEKVVLNLFQRGSAGVVVNMVKMTRQIGGRDCGLFAIAVATAIANGLEPSQLEFEQKLMRDHLSSCFKDKALALFPTK